ncbi:hypothetical protein AVEN_155207-1 [Araneus ventricosus]|uniref:Uncharacterized protein n=1 Tax=Araneus ventricosus TaxID=182803 RepID=A0A4Y2EMK6_ARAVE|nr:hypothetical protein AVEN_155207-1 [Araneus ventricosus]
MGLNLSKLNQRSLNHMERNDLMVEYWLGDRRIGCERPDSTQDPPWDLVHIKSVLVGKHVKVFVVRTPEELDIGSSVSIIT